MAPERVRLPADPRSASRARTFTAHRLRVTGMDREAGLGLLLVSELATNALRHTGGGFEVVVTPTRSGVRVAVSDDDPTRPREPLVPPSPESEGGRGLAIVDELADRWGVEREPPGKSVWFELDRRG